MSVDSLKIQIFLIICVAASIAVGSDHAGHTHCPRVFLVEHCNENVDGYNSLTKTNQYHPENVLYCRSHGFTINTVLLYYPPGRN